MSIGKQIAIAAEEKWGNAPYTDIDVIIADADDWTALIDECLATLHDRIRNLEGALIDCLNDDGFAVINGYGALSDETKDTAHQLLSNDLGE